MTVYYYFTLNGYYLTDSMCWSVLGFLLGYFVCRLEVQIRDLIEEHRDHS